MTHEPPGAETISPEEIDRRAVVELAKQNPRVREGELEVDRNAVVSWGGDNGAYVQAWLWVEFTDTPLDRESKNERENTPSG